MRALSSLSRRLRASPNTAAYANGEAIRVAAFTVFFSFVRIEAFLSYDPVARHADATALSVRITQRNAALRPQVAAARTGREWHVVIEVLVDRANFPDGCRLVASDGRCRWTADFATLIDLGQQRIGSLTHRFVQIVADHGAAPEPPRLLDIGGRARSGIDRRRDYPGCAVTVFDILPAAGVDVVGDAHALSSHFAPDTFDFIAAVAVFEHLLMPWKVAVEMNRVMKTGGHAFIHSHQTIGMHDLPWDYLRFSSDAWAGFFNARTGFEIVDTLMTRFSHIVVREWGTDRAENEKSGGFEDSSVIVRKIADTTVHWDVALEAVVSSPYPG